MEIFQLQYFVKVAELGNFTRAAEACLVSQPSLSQAIANLEQELGSPVFERLPRGVRLTPAGEVMLERAQQILALVQDAKLRTADSEDQGVIALGAIPTVAPYLLPPILTGFTHEHPNVFVEIHEEVTEVCVRECLSGKLDLALLAAPVNDSQLAVEPLMKEELLLVVPTDHPLAGRVEVSADEIAGERMILLNDAHCLSRDVEWYCRARAVHPITTDYVSQLATVLELVSLGQGVSLVPSSAMRRDMGAGRKYVRLAGDKPTRTLVLVWHKRKHRRRLVERFREWVRDHAREDGRDD